MEFLNDPDEWHALWRGCCDALSLAPRVLPNDAVLLAERHYYELGYTVVRALGLGALCLAYALVFSLKVRLWM